MIHVYIRDINGLYEQGIKHHLLEIQSSYRQSDSLSLSHTHTHTHTGLEGQPETWRPARCYHIIECHLGEGGAINSD